MNKSILLIILLITYSLCDDCTSLTTETTCTAKSGCKWTATPTCTGDDSCTAKKTSEKECTDTTYTPKVACTYTPAEASKCEGHSSCSAGSASTEACTVIKYGGTQCTWDTSDADNPTCTGGDADTGGECVQGTSSNCTTIYFKKTACTFTQAKSASCGGGTGCNDVTALTTATACEAKTFDGTETKCVYATGTCAADTDTNSDPKDNNSGFIKFSFLFSLLYLLF